MTKSKIRALATARAVVSLFSAAAIPSPAQTFKTLYQFTGGTDGSNPVAPLIQRLDGSYYGATDGPTGGTIFAATAQGTLTTLSILPANSGPTSLVLSNDGNYYGTELTGGADFDGLVFQQSPGAQ